MSPFSIVAAAPTFPLTPTSDDGWFTATYVAAGAIVVFIILAVLLRRSAVGRRIATTAVLVVTIAFILIGFTAVTIESRLISANERVFTAEVTEWLNQDYGIDVTDVDVTARLRDRALFTGKQNGGNVAVHFIETETGEVGLVDANEDLVTPQ